MLLRLVIKNFKSFYDDVQFDMFPNMKIKSLGNHIYTESYDVPLLKISALFGANASGKTNLVKALDFIHLFATQKNFLKSIELDKHFHLLRENPTNEPICLGIEFETSRKYFFYIVEIASDSIVSESLYEMFPLEGKRELIFQRKANKIEYGEGENPVEDLVLARENLLSKNSMSSIFSLNREFPIIKDERFGFAFSWIDTKLKVLGINTSLPTLINVLRKDKALFDFVKEMTRKIEVGVNGISIKESDFDKWAEENDYLLNLIPTNVDKDSPFLLEKNDFPVFLTDIVDGTKKVYEILYENMGRNGFIGNLDSRLQSDGTLRALILLPSLYCAMSKGETVVIDEINQSLSHTMVRAMVEIFAKTPYTNGQLIFTTHDERLLGEKDLLRSDEIWFVEKTEGISELYTHNDFKEHPTISRLRGYEEGRFGAIRHINFLSNE